MADTKAEVGAKRPPPADVTALNRPAIDRESFCPPSASSLVRVRVSAGDGVTDRDSRVLAQGAEDGKYHRRWDAGHDRFTAGVEPVDDRGFGDAGDVHGGA